MSFRVALSLAFLAALGPRAGFAEPRSPIDVTLDQAKIIELPPATATIVLGNPTFADVTPVKGSDSLYVVTAHGFGETNLIAISRDGQVLAEHEFRVLRPKRLLVLQKGDSRVSLACNPDCMPTVQLGDDIEHFKKAGDQITSRNQLGQGAGVSVAGK